ncbi:DUF934 domain-containing protein [Candidatus Methylospira mobilis]|uniref:DUF934 domain-containing protein n=1 Tax=Candidatus Methylospira mobilis TaxID=1808979 RepID=A0A5Q0BE51_9GAMM|nr:DUF934 domain-containing protein [Candidatus Methylospira mobilis]QFY42153.1 DUF934 domain-containing protein [Candidatus Methylospira mobilis]WNV03168.1 DUF934 domain-containing protein [Candidatus Methylospira mobilis]
MQIIKDGRIIEDDWRHLSDDAAVAEKSTLTLARWLAEKENLTVSDIGVRLNGGDDAGALENDLARVALVVLDIPAMTDGRCFSQARQLRDSIHFQGEIRARGSFIRDQVYFLSRVGVNSFEPSGEQPLASFLTALSDFSVSYQTSSDRPGVLFAGRHGA